MAFQEFKQQIKSLHTTLMQIKKEGIGLTVKEAAPGMYDYQKMRVLGIQRSVPSLIEHCRKHLESLPQALSGPELTFVLAKANDLELHYANKDLGKLIACVESIADALAEANVQQKGKLIQTPEKIPSELREEIIADLQELEKCLNAGCYRSCVILCGRLLETTLHRKYFDVTGSDLLEKAPGIGLGKIIAKLKEHEVVIDPGLTQQIHLINQVRVFSVHKKEETFYPSESQAKAIMLLTMDVMQKFFGK